MIDVWAELSKVYNMENIPDEAMSIIGDVMLAWSDEQDAISRYAVKSLIEVWHSGDTGNVEGLLKMIDALPSQPPHEGMASTQPEIIRCKDCKYQNRGKNECESWNLCNYRPWLHIPTDDEHYCGYAERREDG